MIDNMDNLETFYKEKVGDLLFHYKQSAIGSKIRSPQSEFKWFMNESDAKYKMNEYLMTKGVEKVMEEVGDISVFSKELSQNCYINMSLGMFCITRFCFIIHAVTVN